MSQPKEGVTVDFASRRSANDDRQFDDVFVKLETRTLNNQFFYFDPEYLRYAINDSGSKNILC